MEPRLKNPAYLLPDLMPAIMALVKVAQSGTVPARTLELMHLRASQINGCSLCVDLHVGALEKSGETARRMLAVTAWRESPSFTGAERAALALAEAATRIADGDGVPDDVWKESTKHYDEKQLAALVLNVALINFFNRLNVTTRQVAGSVEIDR